MTWKNASTKEICPSTEVVEASDGKILPSTQVVKTYVGKIRPQVVKAYVGKILRSTEVVEASGWKIIPLTEVPGASAWKIPPSIYVVESLKKIRKFRVINIRLAISSYICTKEFDEGVSRVNKRDYSKTGDLLSKASANSIAKMETLLK